MSWQIKSGLVGSIQNDVVFFFKRNNVVYGFLLKGRLVVNKI